MWKAWTNVSAMESNLRPEDELALAERAAVAPWIDSRPMPWWLAALGGVLPAGLVLVLGERDALHPALFVVATLVLVAAYSAWVGVITCRVGAYPRLRNAPPEFVPVVRAYFAGCVLVIAAIVVAYLVVGPWLAAIVTVVGFTGGLLLYQRRYAAVAEAVRRRVA